MRRKVTGRLLVIAFVLFLSFLFFFPSMKFYADLPDGLKGFFPGDGVKLGLDLQGGIHLVMRVDTVKAAENVVERAEAVLREVLEDEAVSFEGLDRTDPLEIRVRTGSSEALERVRDLALQNLPAFMVQKSNAQGLILAMRPAELKGVLDSAVTQALETIRNRVDQFGVTEPLIQKRGEDQILIQLPGIKDPQRAIAIIGKTALLEFKIVAEGNPVAAELPARIPLGKEEELVESFRDRIGPDEEILFEREVDEDINRVSKIPYLLKNQALITGRYLTDARVSIGDFNEPYVSLSFDREGGELLEKVTGENVKRRMAIVLDNVVYSAPVIQERIGGGRAQITGQYTTEDAHDLAIVLRAGALPAPVHIIQNVTVGPSLGRDSIEKGMVAGIIATILVVVFMALYYRLSGMLADVALVLNVIMLIGALAALKATLTLPGIAGIILAIGMAVDSNVLILERIREELRLGKPVRLAIDSGYEKAFVTIVDSHVTTLITAFALFLFGTGPIKGFAVTLSLGVSINLFTALVATRVVYDFVNSRWRPQRMSI